MLFVALSVLDFLADAEKDYLVVGMFSKESLSSCKRRMETNDRKKVVSAAKRKGNAKKS